MDMLTINPISTNLYNANLQRKQKNIAFGSIMNEVAPYGILLYRNTTKMFREDMDWARIVDRIIKEGKKIYCYACSDGSEPYTIALNIINRLGFEKASKDFKIIARDVDNNIINRAKACAIAVRDSDKRRIMEKTKPEFVSLFRDLCSLEETHIVDDKLAKCVDFNHGNLFFDCEKLNFDNSVLFFRNVWPYLPDWQRNQLIVKLSDKFKKDSLLVVGEFDKAQTFSGKDKAFESFMSRAGFKEIFENVYQKI